MVENRYALTFEFPTIWRHGRGLAAQTARMLQELGRRKPLLLTDRLLLSLGVAEPVTSSLQRADIKAAICQDVTAEPTVGLFESLLEKIDLARIDAIIAVGGGSVIDVAKGLALIGSFGGHIRDYAGFGKVPGVSSIAVIAIPTTSGTGSEISDGVVLIDEQRDTKFLVLSKKICPTLALTDPLLTVAMPPAVTANSGADALVHAIESYFSKGASPATEPFSLRAIKLLGRNIAQAFHNGNDLEAREQMQIGATLAMTAGMNAYLGLCHALAMPLCALYRLPHGRAVGSALPVVMRYNAQARKDKEIDVLRAMGLIKAGREDRHGIEQAYVALDKLLRTLGIPCRLGACGYQESHLPTIVRETLNSAQCPSNPREPSADDIAELVRQMI